MSEVYLFLLAGGVVEDDGAWPVLVRTAQGHLYRSQLGNLPPDLAAAAVVLVLPMELAGYCVIGPIPGRRPSRETLGYATEEQLAAPLEALHLAFGAEDQEGRRKVWVIALECLRQLLSKLQQQGIDPIAVHVDADLLSAERVCALWFEGRWLLGGSEGACLALRAQAAQALKQKYASMPWMAEAGSAGAADCDQQISSAVEILMQGTAGAVDLRQGALRRRRIRPAWRGLASGVVLALLMACVVDQVRAQWLMQQASLLHAENVRVLQRWAPEQLPGGDLATQIRLLEHRPKQATAVEQLVLLSEQLVGVGNVVIERAESTPEQGWRVDVVAHGFADLERLGARLPGMRMEQGRQGDRGVSATLSWREAE
ncbi:type II secretion system protein GspL [Pseudomonas fluorescens]|uniref:type II secretion system protein GspL n=1 Tax=Pseudomonas fluorescens TaxID=294 RepID=UPI0020C1DD85|nr:type II secretion system protein GspL [Pseudomonas fluorescens]UTL91496.1 type II secretion system protein GspL [Pseudomonas fluorescens]